MNHKMDYYVSTFEQIQERISDPQVAMTILQEIAKDSRMDRIRSEREQAVPTNQPATQKQIEFMKDLDLEIKPGLNTKDASALITEAQERRQK